jgi:predicted kinase
MTEKRTGVAFYGKVRIPTIGHRKAIDTAKGIAKKVSGQLKIGLSGTSKPLTSETKKAHAEMMFNHPVQTGDEHTKNLFSYLSHLNDHHDEIHLVAGSDRAPEYRRTLQQYNGKADRSGKVNFNFKKWKVHEVEGERGDVDKHPTQMSKSELEKSVSATRLEGLAKSDDYDGFKAYHPGFPEKHVRKVYDQIRMGSSEQSKPKSVKQIRSKKVVREEFHEHGELDHKKFGPMLDSFVQFASKKIGIKSMPSMRLEKDPMSSSFGGYNPAEKSIVVISKNRHPMDIYRTVAHELVHHKQNEDGRLGKDIRKEGATGSPIENEANAEAGKIMRWFAKANPEMFKSGYVTESYIEEGLQDPAKMKAVFLAGGPGSGKDFIMSRVLHGHGLSEINSDNAFEHLMKKRGLDPMMPKEQSYERDIERGKAKNLTKEKERLALAGRRGLIINGTADDPEKIATIKKQLEDSGYETKMLFVNTSNEVSKQRNLSRGLEGGRKVPDGTDKNGRPDGTPDIRGEKWESAQKAKENLRKIFGDEHYREVDNSDDIREVHPERKKEIEKEHLDLFKHYREFTSTPAQTTAAKEWTDAEKKKRGITQYKPARATRVSTRQQPQPKYEPNASELEQAKRLGVQHIGNGQFGKDKDAVSHVSKNGQLTMAEEKKYKKIKACWKGYEAIGFKNKNGKRVPNCVPVDEDFEKMVNENKPSDREWGKPSLTKIYSKATPGQKKITKEDNNIPPGTLPVQDGLGPEFTRRTSPSYIGFAGIQESVERWANNEKTISRFEEKYGNDAKTKLYEAAQRLNGLKFGDKKPKFFTHLREAWEAKGGRDMGTVLSTAKEPFNEDDNLDKVNQISKELKDMTKKKTVKLPHVNDVPDNLKQFKVDEDWQKVNRKDKTDGLSQKAVNAYRRENPGSKLSTAVTEKNPKGKRAKRRLSFCRRMGGMKKRLTSAKTARDPDSNINKALRRWNCEE